MTANGKLLITGEYFVLDGALALAVPCQFSQQLFTKNINGDDLFWQSLNHEKEEWFSAHWKINGNRFVIEETTDILTAQRLESIFNAAAEENQNVHPNLKGKSYTTQLDFPRQWGLGTSSTLISLLAKHLSVSPYQLLAKTFGGSAYDIACAQAEGPILYQRTANLPSSKAVKWNPVFKKQIYFVYQGQKQNSRDGIQHYRKISENKMATIEEINSLTLAMLHTKSTGDCRNIIEAHENIIASTLNLPKIKEQRFNDFPGTIKSLGAWGGDFVMVLSPWNKQKTQAYFNTKGCSVVLGFDEMVLQPTNSSEK